MTTDELLKYLEVHEIDYRIESNFCCGYIFYFLDGSVYPRRYLDNALEGREELNEAESTDHIIAKALAYELKKDWKHRIEAATIPALVEEAWKYIVENTKKTKNTN